MTFDPNAKLEKGRVGRATKTAGVAGGGLIGIIAIALISQFLGVDLSGLLGSGSTTTISGADSEQLTGCSTGADANESDDCRVQGAASSLDAFWEKTLGSSYTQPAVMLFSGSISTGCGNATSAVGPFYCSADQTVYLDTSFYGELRESFGASAGSLAQMYILAHEFGHHIQEITGIMDKADRTATGATSDSVRLELQADCFAGAWAGSAAETTDENGVPFLQPLTSAQIADALNAAASVGDDHIQEQATGSVNPDQWTHGSSEQRERWFSTGYKSGVNACDTFSVAGSKL